MRIVKRLLVTLLAVTVLFAGWVTYIAVTTADPHDAPGWTRLKDLPRPRGEVAAAVGARLEDPGSAENPERFFVIGGLARAGRTVRWVDVYDPTSNEGGTWFAGPDLPEQRHHAGAVGSGGAVYVTGGAKKALDWTPERTFWLLFPNENEWRVGPVMPEGRMGHQMAAIGRDLYVIGGRGETSNVLIFDSVTDKWRTGAQMPRKRDHLGIAVQGTKIFAIGGRDDELTARVDVYDTEQDSWSEGPPLPIPMSAMAAGETLEPDEGIHVVGGEESATFGGGVIAAHHFLPKDGRAWVTAPLPIIAVHGAASGVIFGELFIAGGARRQGSLSPLGWTGVLQRYEGT